MNVETLIYAYLAVCTSMILFNCVCIFVFRGRDASIQRRSTRLEYQIMRQIQRIEDGDLVEESHREYLRKRLVRTSSLMVLDETLDRMLTRDKETVWRYVREIRTVFSYLAFGNHYRTTIKLTYFAYVVKKYRIVEGRSVDPIIEVMLELLHEPGLYCRENALQAIYSTGDCALVLRAMHIVDKNERFHHAKLLTDGLLTFRGDQKALAEELWAEFPSFSAQMRVVIMDYIRFSGLDMREEVLALLADDRQDDELRFACIRYFGRYPYEPANPILLAFAEEPQKRRWEYAAIAVTALAAYPGEHSVEVLKKSLHSSNWYVRFNAAKSLETFSLSYVELCDVLDGNDRYAREILQYRMDMRNAKREKEGSAV